MTRGPGWRPTPGMVLGTFGYMAPEQVRGLPVDHRADIFAFGAVLYEMLTGERAFKGETAADTMTAILSKDRRISTLHGWPSPPASIASSGAVSKSRRSLRFQSANDLAFALETLRWHRTRVRDGAAMPPQPAPRRASAWLPWAIAAVAVLAAASVVASRGIGRALRGAGDHFTRISEAAGEETSPSLSPDGSTVAYSMRVNGSWDIYSQRVGGRNATPIVNDPQRDEGGAAFSPDGSLIAFHESDDVGRHFRRGRDRRVGAASHRRRVRSGLVARRQADRLRHRRNRRSRHRGWVTARCTSSTLPAVRRASWSTATARSRRGRRRARGSSTGATPAGSATSTRSRRRAAPACAVTQDAAIDWSPVWSPDGRFIYFSSDRGGAMNLWRIAVDQSSGQAQGAPEPVTAGVQAAAALPRFSKDGSRLVFRSRVAAVNPVAIPFDPSTLRAGVPVLLDTQNNVRIPSDVSRDGKQIAFYSLGDQQEDIFVGPPDGPIRRVTDDAPRDRAPVFTPDGRSLVFYSNARWQLGRVDGRDRWRQPAQGRRRRAGRCLRPSLAEGGQGCLRVHLGPRRVHGAARAVAGVIPDRLPGTRAAREVLQPDRHGRRTARVWPASSSRTAGARPASAPTISPRRSRR